MHLQTYYGAIKLNDELIYVVRKSLSDLKQEDVKNIIDDVVREKVEKAIKERGFKEAFNTPVLMNEEKGIEIKRVRLKASSVKSPIHLKKQRDASAKEYKRNYYVVNDENYCMAIYEGIGPKGKSKRTFKIFNNLDSARGLKRDDKCSVIPLSDKDDYPLKWILKIGTMVFFYENSPSEIYEAQVSDLSQRLYKVYGLEGDGRIRFIHCQDAEGSSKDQTRWTKECNRVKLRVTCNNLKLLIEGVDFDMTVTGEIKFKRFLGNE